MNLQFSKLAISLALLLNISAAHAGDNGSYLKCSSKSGRTQVKINDDNFGTGVTVELSIDKSYASIDEMVFNKSCEINDCERTPMVRNPELAVVKYDHGLFILNNASSQMIFSIARQDAQPNFGDGRYLVSGTDPRNNNLIANSILVSCKRIANPI